MNNGKQQEQTVQYFKSLGDDGAKKTSLIIKYISGFFIDDLKLTIGVDFYSKITTVKEKN